MHELISTIQTWLESGKSIAMATVIRVEGSSPRPVGSKLIVSDQGEMEGSVSGGCVESSVVEEALDCLKDGNPRLLHYGIENSNAWSVGLACGGKIDVFIEPLFHPANSNGFSLELFQKFKELIQADQDFAIALIISKINQGQRGLLLADKWIIGNSSMIWSNLLPKDILEGMIGPRIIDLKPESGLETSIFIEPIFPRKRLIIVGAVHIAVSLVMFANNLGYKTIIIDPRTAFLTPERFPLADELIPKWPQDVLPTLNLTSRDCIVILSHDEKIDVPAIFETLKTPIGYIGMLGSKKTRDERFNSLKKLGSSEKDFKRIHAPIGLDINAVDPMEIAVSIILH
jgi:xanthine dehydrogenase accessory factor